MPRTIVRLSISPFHNASKAVTVVDIDKKEPKRKIKGTATQKGKDVEVTLGPNVILTLTLVS